MDSKEYATVRTATIHEIAEDGRNDHLTRESGNRLEQVILQDQEGVLAWVSERLAKQDGQNKPNLNIWENLKAA